MLLYPQLVLLISYSGSSSNGTSQDAPGNSTDTSNISVETKTTQIQFLNSSYFMSIRGSLSETLVFESKAYCSAFDHLSDQFMQKRETSGSDISTGRNSTMKTEEYTNQSIGSSLWDKYKFDSYQTARINWTVVDQSRYLKSERVYNMNAVVHYRTANKWSPRVLRPSEMLTFENHLQKRVQELKNDSHSVEFPALESLFFNQTMTDQLFTNKIDEEIKKLNPAFEVKNILRGSRFEVVDCKEIKGKGVSNIILAINGSIPIIPKEFEEEYLKAIKLH